MFFRVVALALFAVLLLPGIFHFPPLLLVVPFALWWLWAAFGWEIQAARRRDALDLREAVERLADPLMDYSRVTWIRGGDE